MPASPSADLTPRPAPPARVVVVGGGISGLVAALRCRQAGAQVTVIEAGPQVGGKLRRGQVGDLRVDVGAEALLARRPEAVDLARELGLDERLVHPRPVGASIWSRGRMHPLPPATLMGVPGSADQLGGLLTPGEAERLALASGGLADPVDDDDVSVGAWVAEHFGQPVLDRLVEPLLGGVYAGRVERLSLAATVPALWQVAREGGQVMPRVAALLAEQRKAGGDRPVFAGLRGGVGALAEVLAGRLADLGVAVHTATIARRLERAGGGWEVVVGPTPAERRLEADAVVLAVPAGPAARLLAGHAPSAAAALAEIDYASVAIVTLVLRADQPDGMAVQRNDSSGFLVPAVDGRVVKAATFSHCKWAWVSEAGARPGQIAIRASVGRRGEVADLQLPDDELAHRVEGDLSDALGVPVRPLDRLVTRWGGALPQYDVGHVQRVERIRAGLAGLAGVEVCGAAYDGVGVAACIASAERAAREAISGRETIGS